MVSSRWRKRAVKDPTATRLEMLLRSGKLSRSYQKLGKDSKPVVKPKDNPTKRKGDGKIL